MEVYFKPRINVLTYSDVIFVAKQKLKHKNEEDSRR